MIGDNKRDMKRKAKRWPIVIFVIGVLALVAGIVVLIVRLVAQPSMADADFLVSAGEWVREDEPTVIWDFTEVGEGKLSTDNHLNDYNFIWALDNGKIKIETSWLYDLNDEFDYTLEQGARTLVIKNEDRGIEITFKAKDREKSEEITE